VRPLRLAHRGDGRVAPENSLAAMRAALTVPGCNGLEFDVRFARDGTPVLLHDTTLDRVQGVARSVAEVAVPELASLGVVVTDTVEGQRWKVGDKKKRDRASRPGPNPTPSP